MHSFIKFNRGMLKMPVHWQLWLLLLVTANLLIPLFFLARIEAQVVVATFGVPPACRFLSTQWRP